MRTGGACSALRVAINLLEGPVHTVELIHNPWAAHPLALGAFRLSQRTIVMPDGEICRQDGVSSADLLGIPQPWPVPDAE